MGRRAGRNKGRSPSDVFFLKDFRLFPAEIPQPVREIVHPAWGTSALSAPVVGAWVSPGEAGHLDIRVELLLAHHVQLSSGVVAVRFIRLEDFETKGVMTPEEEPPAFWVYRDESVGDYKRDTRWGFIDEVIQEFGVPFNGKGNLQEGL